MHVVTGTRECCAQAIPPERDEKQITAIFLPVLLVGISGWTQAIFPGAIDDGRIRSSDGTGCSRC